MYEGHTEKRLVVQGLFNIFYDGNKIITSQLLHLLQKMNYKLREHKLVVTVLGLTQIKVEAKGTVRKLTVTKSTSAEYLRREEYAWDV